MGFKKRKGFLQVVDNTCKKPSKMVTPRGIEPLFTA